MRGEKIFAVRQACARPPGADVLLWVGKQMNRRPDDPWRSKAELQKFCKEFVLNGAKLCPTLNLAGGAIG